MATIVEVKYFNSFTMKKVEKTGSTPASSQPAWPGLEWDPFGYPAFPIQAATSGNSDKNWYIEEARIKGGFNNTMVSQGVRAYLNEEEPQQDTRESSLIYSGVYNSRTEINQTNVFSIGETITRSLDPHNGSIQKLYASDSNLIIFQENKVSQGLIDKDTTYMNEGGTQTLPPGTVIGQIVPYAGRYGIGTNPESFAFFGNRKYFVDPYRGSVMRLSIDGLTEISEYGMKDYFRDQLTGMDNLYKTSSKAWTLNTAIPATTVTDFAVTGIDECQTFIGSKVLVLNGTTAEDTGARITNIVSAGGTPEVFTITVNIPITLQSSGLFNFDYKNKIVGGWDNFNRYYTVSMQPTPTFVDLNTNYDTLAYDESVRGWVSFFTFKPSFIFSLKGQTYSTVDYSLYNHYQNTNTGNFGIFYGVSNSSTINFLVNANPSTRKVFQTINYEGDNGWKVTSMQSDLTRVDKAPNTVSSDLSGIVYSYDEGLYVDPNSGYPQRVGFNRKENLYTASIINASLFQNGQVVPGSAVTGLKGYLLDVTISTDETTDPNGPKELWSVGTTFVQSS
tara:strand:+ start:18690 stop:20372 length:1683 start_codon:yes stop_codon:yes gene_type:complete